MKQIIFKGQYGWYIVARNYQNKNDTAFVNIFFPKDVIEPQTDEKCWIDIQDCSFTSYKGKVGLTIFKYECCLSPKEEAEQNHLNKPIERSNEIRIDTEQLEFY